MRRVLAVAVASVAAAVTSGCGGDGAASGDGAAPATAQARSEVTINIASFKYLPAKLTVKKGAKVTWVNQDKAPHTATAVEGAFDTGRLKLDDSKTLVLDKPGTYRYYCTFHRFMEADLVVTD